MKALADYLPKFDHLRDQCPVRVTLDVIRGRWKASILFELKSGPKRFSALQAELSGVTAQALTTQLRELEAEGIVERRVYPEVPVRVEYSLTEHGLSLSDVMDQLEEWGARHLQRRQGGG